MIDHIYRHPNGALVQSVLLASLAGCLALIVALVLTSPARALDQVTLQLKWQATMPQSRRDSIARAGLRSRSAKAAPASMSALQWL